MIPKVKLAPNQMVLGIKIKMAEINSRTPMAILPYGSKPTSLKYKHYQDVQ